MIQMETISSRIHGGHLGGSMVMQLSVRMLIVVYLMGLGKFGEQMFNFRTQLSNEFLRLQSCLLSPYSSLSDLSDLNIHQIVLSFNINIRVFEMIFHLSLKEFLNFCSYISFALPIEPGLKFLCFSSCF